MLTLVSTSNSNQLYTIIGVSLGVFALFVVCCLVWNYIRKKDKTPKEPKVKKIKEPKIKEPKIKKTLVEEVVYSDIPNIYDLFGGKDNVLNYELKGSRLVVELNDVDKINAEELKKSGVEKILAMSKKVTLVGSGIPNILNNLKNL